MGLVVSGKNDNQQPIVLDVFPLLCFVSMLPVSVGSFHTHALPRFPFCFQGFPRLSIQNLRPLPVAGVYS